MKPKEHCVQFAVVMYEKKKSGAFCLRRELPEPGARNFTSCSFAMIALGWVGYFVLSLIHI